MGNGAKESSGDEIRLRGIFMKNIKVSILSFIALIFFLGVYFLIKTATWSIPDAFDRLTIRNGTTGDFYEVTGGFGLIE